MISPTALPFSLTLSIGDVHFNLRPSSPSSSSSPPPIVSVTQRGRNRHGGSEGVAACDRTADHVSDVVADLTNFSGTLSISSVAFRDDREDDHDEIAAGKRRDDLPPRALCHPPSAEATNERIRTEASSSRNEQRVAAGPRAETRTPEDRLRRRLPPVLSAGDERRLRRSASKCDGTAVSELTGDTSWATFPIGKGCWGASAAAPNDGCALSADAVVGDSRNRARRAGGSALQRGGRSHRSRSEPRTHRGSNGIFDGTVRSEQPSQGGRRRRRSKSRTRKSQESKSLPSKSSRRNGKTKTHGRSLSRSARRRRDTNDDQDASEMRRHRRAQSAPRSQRDFFREASSAAASSSLHNKDRSSRNKGGTKDNDPRSGQCLSSDVTAPPLLRARSDGQSGQEDQPRSKTITRDETRRGKGGGPSGISHTSPSDAAISKEGQRSGLAASERAPPPEDDRALHRVTLNHAVLSDGDGSVERRNWAQLSIRERLLAEVDLINTDTDADVDADKAESKRNSFESTSSTFLDKRTGLQKRWSTLREQLLMEIESEMDETDLDTDGSKRSLTSKVDSDSTSPHHIRRRRSSLVLRQRLLAEVAEMESESSLSCADHPNSTVNGECLPLREWLLDQIAEIDTSTDDEAGGDVCGGALIRAGDGTAPRDAARVQALCADAKSSFEAFRSAVLGPPPPPEGTGPHQYPVRDVRSSYGERGGTSLGATGTKSRKAREECDQGGALICPSSRNQSGTSVDTGERTGETELAEEAKMKEQLSHEAPGDEGGRVGHNDSEGPRTVGRRTESRLRHMLGEMHSLMSTTTHNHNHSLAVSHKEQQTKSTVLSCASSQPTNRS